MKIEFQTIAHTFKEEPKNLIYDKGNKFVCFYIESIRNEIYFRLDNSHIKGNMVCHL